MEVLETDSGSCPGTATFHVKMLNQLPRLSNPLFSNL